MLRAERSRYHYKARRRDQADLIKRIKKIAETRARYGYRRIHVLLCHEGWSVNAKCVYRLYHAMGLQLSNKTPKRRVKAKLRNDRTAAVRNNDVWAMGFVHDQLATGKKLRVMTIIDTFSRFSTAIEARFSYRGSDAVETLQRVAKQYRLPKVIRVDEPWYDPDHEVRRVRPTGEIKWRGANVFVGEALARETVGIAEREHGCHIVRFCGRDLGLIDATGRFHRFVPPRARLRSTVERAKSEEK